MWWEVEGKVVQYCDILRFMIIYDIHHKVSPNPNLEQNSNGFALREERDTLWCLLWSTVNLIKSEYWTCMVEWRFYCNFSVNILFHKTRSQFVNSLFQWFEEKQQQIETLDQQLKKLHQSMELLSMQRKGWTKEC